MSALVLGIGLAGTAGTASATISDVGCGEGGALCRWTVDFNGEQVGAGLYTVGPDGSITLPQAVRLDLPGGASAGVSSLFGNADPVLGFNFSAGTGAAGGTFSFNTFLPISLNGPIVSHGEISYSLTATTADGAQISPFLTPKVLSGREVDTSVGGKPAIDKEVDAGDTFFFVGGPDTQSSQTYEADGSFNVDPAYDTMSATVAFSLSPNSNVGISGFIQQTVVPEPSTYALLAAGLAFVGFVARRRLNA